MVLKRHTAPAVNWVHRRSLVQREKLLCGKNLCRTNKGQSQEEKMSPPRVLISFGRVLHRLSICRLKSWRFKHLLRLPDVLAPGVFLKARCWEPRAGGQRKGFGQDRRGSRRVLGVVVFTPWNWNFCLVRCIAGDQSFTIVQERRLLLSLDETSKDRRYFCWAGE